MRFTFNIVPLAVHTLLSLVLLCLDPIGRKVINSWYDAMNFSAYPRVEVHLCNGNLIRNGTGYQSSNDEVFCLSLHANVLWETE